MSNGRGARYSALSAHSSPLSAHGLPLIVCALIGIASVQPLFASPIPTGADALLHFYRIAAWDELWSHGIVWSRWLPNFAFGYGYPLMNYHPPLAYALGALVHRAGLALLPAMQLTWALSAVAATVGMYGWVSAVSHSQRAGLIAAAAYVFAPYALFNLFTRGSFAESIGLALAPWVFLGIQRLTQTGQWRFGLLIVAAYAAVVLSHVIAALLVSLLAGAYLISCAWAYGGRNWRGTLRTGASVAGALLIGLGLTAFFWLPAPLETGLIQIQRGTGGYADFSAHFLTLSQLLSPPLAPDPHFIGQTVPTSLSWIALGLAFLGIVLAVMRPRSWPSQSRAQFGLIGLATLVACGMTLSVSNGIWQLFPVLRFLQYPFRFLGVASLGLAFAAGLGFAALESAGSAWIKNVANGICAACVISMAIYAFTWQTSPNVDSAAITHAPTISEVWDTERRLGTIGTTSFGEYLPRAVVQVPSQPAFDPTHITNRIDAGQLPTGTQITSAQFDPLRYTLGTQSATPFTLTVNTFYFEGWNAYLDQQPTSLHPSTPNGLMQIALPAGTHAVEIRFERTPIQRAAELISASTVVLGLGLGVWHLLRKRRTVVMQPESMPMTHIRISWLLVLGMGLAGMTTFKTSVIDLTDNVFRHTRLNGDALSEVSDARNINFDNKVRLIGLDAPNRQVAAGEIFQFDQFWKLIEQTGADFSISTKVFDANGVEYGHYDSPHPNQIFPTSRATLSDYLLDTRRIPIDATTPPGQYIVETSVYYYGDTRRLLPALDASGGRLNQNFAATAAQILTITVTHPTTLTDPATLEIPYRVNVPLTADVTLIGHTLPPSLTLHTGDSFGLETYWQAQGTPATDDEICFVLQQPDRTVPLRCAGPVPGFPTREWRTGDVWRAGHAMRIPPQTEAGDYAVLITGMHGSALPIGQINVTAPTRTFVLPEGITLEPQTFDNGVALAGYRIDADVKAGQPITVTLFWHTGAPLEARLKVFVQLVDAQNNRIVGNDQMPGSEMAERPTTDWVAGEFIADTHHFEVPADLPAGEYKLLIGLYDEGTLKRVTLADGRDSVLLHPALRIAAR